MVAVVVVAGFADFGLGGSTYLFRARVQESRDIAGILGRGLKGRC